MKAKEFFGKLLIVFLLVSIGVAIGKEMAVRSSPAPAVPVAEQGETKVVVCFYMRGIPCIDCTIVENTTERIVNEEYADAVAQGDMEFVTVDYLKNTALADKYKIGQPTVLIVQIEDGEETRVERLQDVLLKARNKSELEQYIRNGINRILEGDEE
ncbi:MAG: hypothetical protein U5N86_04755 [Planctomycetota bacterium]|nr:hypothetical protein [Planctomycetota bacterium]